MDQPSQNVTEITTEPQNSPVSVTDRDLTRRHPEFAAATSDLMKRRPLLLHVRCVPTGQARCSHFQSACYFAATVSRQTTMGYPCTAVCPRRGRAVGLLPGIPVPMGEETPEG